MSIAEQINFGTQQTNILAQNLSALGQQVGQQLSMREYQRQAAEELPAMQQSYSTALDQIQSGDLKGGYRGILNAQLKYASSQNPFIENMNKLAGGVAEQAVSDFMQNSLANIQYGGRGQTADASGIPAVNKSVYGFQGVTDLGSSPYNQDIDAAFVSDVPQEELGVNPQGYPVVEAPLPKDTPDPAATRSVTPAPTPSASPAPAPTPQATPMQAAAMQNNKKVNDLPVEQQANAARQFTLTETDIDPKQYEIVKTPGLEKYLEGFVGFAVPTKKWEETSARELQGGGIVRGTEQVTPQARKNFFEGIDKNPSTLSNVKLAVETMKDRQMTSLFKEFGGDIYALREATGATPTRQGGDAYSVEKKDGKVMPLTSSQYRAIQTIASIVPVTAENAGGTPAIFKKGKLTEAQAIEIAVKKLGRKATDEQIAAEVEKLLAKQEL